MKIKKIFFLAIIFNALTWIIVTPIWQYPDEQAHFSQVQNIAEQNVKDGKNNTSLEIEFSEVILDTKRTDGNNKFTYNPSHNIEYTNTQNGEFEDDLKRLPRETRTVLIKQEATENPPLYYTMASFFYKLANSSSLIERVFAVRLFSVLLYMLIAIVVYKASIYIFKDELKRLMLCSSILFLPMFIHASTGVLPDPLTNLIFTSLIAVCLSFLNTKLQITHLMTVISLFILGIFTRQQIIIFIPIFLLAIFLYLIKTKKYKIIIIFLFLSIYLFFWEAKHKYLVPEVGNQRFILSPNDFISYLYWTLNHTLKEVIPWYFGVYKWLSLTLPILVYQAINRLIILSVVGNAIVILGFVKKKTINYTYIFLVGSTILYFLIFTFGDFFFHKLFGYSFGIQGRYFFPMIFAQISVLILGLLKFAALISEKMEILMDCLILFGVISFNVYTLYFLAGSYYDTSNLSNFLMQSSQYKPYIIKGINMFLIPSFAIFFQISFFILYTRGRLIGK